MLLLMLFGKEGKCKFRESFLTCCIVVCSGMLSALTACRLKVCGLLIIPTNHDNCKDKEVK